MTQVGLSTLKCLIGESQCTNQNAALEAVISGLVTRNEARGWVVAIGEPYAPQVLEVESLSRMCWLRVEGPGCA